MKLVGPLAARSPGLGLRLVLALEIERHCRADEILQGHLIDLVAFVDVDGAPDIPVEAGGWPREVLLWRKNSVLSENPHWFQLPLSATLRQFYSGSAGW